MTNVRNFRPTATVPPTADIGQMLTYRRPHNHPGEAAFVKRFITPVATTTIADAHGAPQAFTVDVGDAPRYMFCAHVDSVHDQTNPEVRQTVSYDPVRGEYLTGDGAKDCLGADDAAGCYVLLRMIAANTPGRYVFFRGEEKGGIGSRWCAANAQHLSDGIDAAMQFDRRGTHSIITRMFNGRTCSDAFAMSLSRALGLGHECDATGSFTDTANFTSMVPECTNVSVGYENEHCPGETLDAFYLERLVDAMIRTFATDPRLEIVGVTADTMDDNDPYALHGRWDTSSRGFKRAKVQATVDDFLELEDAGDMDLLIESMDPMDLAELLDEVREELVYLRGVVYYNEGGEE